MVKLHFFKKVSLLVLLLVFSILGFSQNNIFLNESNFQNVKKYNKEFSYFQKSNINNDNRHLETELSVNYTLDEFHLHYLLFKPYNIVICNSDDINFAKKFDNVVDDNLLNNYYSLKYAMLSENSPQKRIYWDLSHGTFIEPENLTLWGGFWNIVGKIGLVGCLYDAGTINVDEHPEAIKVMLGFLGLNIVARWGLAPLYIK